MSVFVVGSLHLDIVLQAPHLPRVDETVAGSAVDYAFGGKGGNQAVAAALHGAKVAMAGRVGDDWFARQLMDFLDRAGVDRGQVQSGQGASGMSAAIVDQSGDYGAVIVSAANLEIDAAAITVPGDCAVLLLQNEIPEPVNVAAARAAQDTGAQVILNPAPMRNLSLNLITLTDLMVLNRGEAAAVANMAIQSPADARTAAARIAELGPSVLVTLGAEGVAYHGRNDTLAYLPAHPVDVVSSHGAGDAFIGALAARLADDLPMTDALTYAQAAAALQISRPASARLSVTPADVMAFLSARA